MDIRTTMGSYLKASDVADRAVRLTIRNCAMEKVGSEGSAETKPVLYFNGTEKGLVLNVTNSNTIADLYGYETDSWVGKPIEVFHAMTDYAGRQVECIRVRGVVTQQAPAAPAAQPPVQQYDGPPADYVSPDAQFSGDSEIPF